MVLLGQLQKFNATPCPRAKKHAPLTGKKLAPLPEKTPSKDVNAGSSLNKETKWVSVKQKQNRIWYHSLYL